jgi:AraC family transcriptional regulator
MGKLRKLCTAYPPRKVYAAAVMKLGTEHGHHRRIARAIEAILIAPRAPHTVDRLASVAHLSPFHLSHQSTSGARQECVTDLLIPIRRR